MRLVVHNYFPGWTRDDAGFEEGKHPRVKNGPNAGQFAPKGGGAGVATVGKYKISPYFSKKFHEPTSKEDWQAQTLNVLKKSNAHPTYRDVVKMLLTEGPKFGMGPVKEEQLKNKIIESLNIQAENLKKKGDFQKANKIALKLQKWGVSAPQATAPPPPAPAPASTPAPAMYQSSSTPEELEKAKNTGPFPGGADVPSAALGAVSEFNAKYQGKTLTTPQELDEKVQAFKAVKAKIAEAEQAEHAAHAEQIKGIMKELDINEEQSEAFLGLTSMLEFGANAGNLIAKFKKYEHEAKNLGYPMSAFECALIKSYSNGSYSSVNHALRKGVWTEQEHVYAKLLNSALRKMPPYTGKVYRGAGLPTQVQELYKPGLIVEERAFTSTSTNPHQGQTEKGNTRYVITAKGRRAADIKKLSHHSSEDEVLFQARTFFKVSKVEGKPGGQMTIHMEEWDE